MVVGTQVTQNDVNQAIGNISKQIDELFDRVAGLKRWSDRTTEADLVALGFDTDASYLVKLIIDELAQLRSLYTGAGTLAVAKDFREQPHKATGLGL